jgi:RES domain-containing protein
VILAAYRIVKRKYREDLLSGAGGMYADGRWTSRGRPVVYTASSISLAILEFTVHYKRRGWAPACVLGHVDIPDELRVETVDIIRLPPDWRNPQPSKELREVGDDWLRRSRAAVLRVPSAIVPEENNLLLNPSHPDFGFITVRSVTDFVFDRRLARTARR